MKKYYIVFAIGLAGFLLSCEDSFLDKPPIGVYSEANINNKEGVNKLLVAAYAHLTGDFPMYSVTCIASSPQASVPATIHGGEAMKGSTSNDQPGVEEFQEFAVTSGNGFVQQLWVYLYDAIDRCNLVLRTLKNTTDMTEGEILQASAEARFLRGHYYFLLKRAFGNVPWIDETTEDKRVPNTENNDGITYVNIWPKIAEDFDFARKNLPATQADLGRANKWAAEAYYAKVLIYRANFGEYPSGYTEALAVLNTVMQDGVTTSGAKYDLSPYYYYNFSAAHENGPESVFAAQHSANDGTTTYNFMNGGAPNGNIEGRFFGVNGPANSPGWGQGWGFVQPSQWYVDKFRVDENGLPYLDMYETNPNSVKNDYGIASNQPVTPDTVALDPRLDWTVGRRGIPFLDYGIMPGKDWTRVQSDGGPYILKKWFVKDSEGGVYTPSKRELRNAINVCIIRYADVLLLAAECEARAGSLDNARALFNKVRDRMAKNSDNPNNWVKLSDGVTNAANYKIGLYPTGGPNDPFQSKSTALDAILFERTLELGFEGHRFYDVVRFGKGEEEFNHFLTTMGNYFDWLKGKTYTDVPDALLPIPTLAITNSQKDGKATLTQNPNY